MLNQEFWKDKKVLVTGHTGFKGSWLSIWLTELGAKVIGYGLDPKTENDNFNLCGLDKMLIDIRGDVRDLSKLKNVCYEYKPEIVFHLAAQPLVRLSYTEPEITYSTNVMGTLHVLECMREFDFMNTGVMITTDKCYENKEKIWGYREDDRMGGYDPYSSSKACAELLINSYRNSFFNISDMEKHKTALVSVRAGNVIGGGDWSQDRIVPDCIRSIESNIPILIRNPKAVRPWQHVLEPLYGYLLLAENLYNNPSYFSGAWNFGPEYHSFTQVWDIANELVHHYGKGEIIDSSTEAALHEANLLYLDITKAKHFLGWIPKWGISKTINMTVEWYKNYESGISLDVCINQIKDYINSK